MFTWLGKSERPVATTAAPAPLASQGQISGTGLAHAKTMGSLPIFSTHSGNKISGPGRDKAMTTSASFIASGMPPSRPSLLVVWHKRHLSTYSALRISKSLRCLPKIPLLSTMKQRPGSAPQPKIRREQATLDAPVPTNAMVTSLIFLPTTLSALISPAKVTVAVPCWSSCQTGISAFSRRVSRIRKHLGCERSSKFTPPNEGCRSKTVSMILFGSFVSSIIGTPSMPPKYLYRRAFPSMTGSPAFGPISPRPNTRVPSLTTATVFHLFVYSYTKSGSSAIARQGAATPGVYQMAKSSKSLTVHLSTVSILPR